MAVRNSFARWCRGSEPRFLDGVSGTGDRLVHLAEMPRSATCALPKSGMGAFVAELAGDRSVKVREAKLVSDRS